MRLAPQDLRSALAGRPGATRSKLVVRVVRDLIALMVVASHLIGAGVVIVLLMVVLPLPDEAGGDEGLLEQNLFAALAYVVLAVPAGLVRGLRLARPITRFMTEDRPPTEDERRRVLRLPIRLMVNQMLLWAGAVVLFGVLNATVTALLGVEVAITIALGGLTTASIAYLLTQRLVRAAVARVLAEAPPRRREVPGVGVRLVFAWALGSMVPVTGALVLAVFALVTDMTAGALARATLVLCGVAILVGLLATIVSARSITDPLRRLRDGIGRVEEGDYDVEVPIYDATEVGYAAAGFNRMVAGLRERERLRDLFGRHVGEDVARKALEEGTELGGEERQAAALFVDIVGSTGFAAATSPSEVVDALNAFFAIVVEVTDDHGGLVNKFAGDAALCVFGAPLAMDDAAGCALRAARALRRRLDDELEGLDAGIGVSAGTVVAGNVGTPERYEYTVIGDPVNEASRLTELAKERPGRLLVSEAVLEAAGEDERRRWRIVEEAELRGRGRTTRIAEPDDAPPP